MFEPLVERRRAGDGKIDLSQSNGDVGLELFLGNTLFLEIKLVEEALLVGGFGNVDKGHRSSWDVRDTQAGDCRYLVRVEQRRIPHDRRTPIVAEQDRPAITQLIDRGGDVGRQVADGVGGNLLRPGALPVAAHIKRRHRVSALRKITDLVTPRVPKLGKSMNAEDQGAAARDRHIQANRSVPQRDEVHGVLVEFSVPL